MYLIIETMQDMRETCILIFVRLTRSGWPSPSEHEVSPSFFSTLSCTFLFQIIIISYKSVKMKIIFSVELSSLIKVKV
jgi:hypothetical protein